MKCNFKCRYSKDKFCNCDICKVDVAKNYCLFCIWSRKKDLCANISLETKCL